MFMVSDTNPNDTTGGGGCICDPIRQIDCKPPYAIFPGNDMENIASPHVVVCKSCAEAMVEQMTHGEILSAGEHDGASVPAEPVHTAVAFGQLPAPTGAVYGDEPDEDDEEIPEV
jgi:hypothetical protein